MGNRSDSLETPELGVRLTHSADVSLGITLSVSLLTTKVGRLNTRAGVGVDLLLPPCPTQ